MESPISSSFMPHDTAKSASRSVGAGSGGLSELVLLLGIVLFIASASLGVGVFLYRQYLTNASVAKLQALERAKAAFEPSLIQRLTKLDDRMHAGGQILSTHVAPTAFFKALEEATLQTISFKSLNFSASDPQHITVQMAGVAQSVNSVALQAEIFSNHGVITNPIFSGIKREADGVHFNFSALINPSAINYVQERNRALNPGPESGAQGQPGIPQQFQGPTVSNQGE